MGVARQYCGRLGKVAQLPGGDVPGLCQPVGTGIGGQGAVSARELDLGQEDRCEAAGVPEDRQGYRSKTELALEMVGPAQERGHLKAGWVAADDAFGMSPSFRRAWRPWGCGTCWTFRPALRCGRRSLPGPVRSIRDSGVPANPGCETVSAGPWSSATSSCRRRPGMRSTVIEGSQGPRIYLFSAKRSATEQCASPAKSQMGRFTVWNLDGGWNAATRCPMLTEDTPFPEALACATRARVGV